ncbi:allantoate amidohydrolase [Granulicella cerasi]|uniref:Allantoate amidohydrolase n=1 Tax=Granulicella cerasi TaxID=741063 RepID=A0ABW1Z717_9BACT|nr:allantoate amidohydrolase [Granulicella cerasi]
MTPNDRAERIIARCRELARISDVEGETTRLFLSPKTRDAHTLLSWWMREAGLEARTDDIGNLRAVRRSAHDDAPTLVLFSHIDTVPNAGAFDGPLGVILGLEAIAALAQTPLPFHIELIAFSEEEGVRFAFPFLSSRAAVGELTDEHLAHTDKDGITVADALRNFDLDPARIATTAPFASNTFAAIEVHIEQGPVLESENAFIAVVEAIVGQSRLSFTFEGQANHAGTTPMALRHDALVAAAHFIIEVDNYASNHRQLVATVGRIEALPGAMNVVPGTVTCTLDVRHPKDESRHAAVAHLVTKAQAAGEHRGVKVKATLLSEQRAVPMDHALTQKLHAAAERAGHDALQLFSGAGHDSMIVASHVPTTMLFVRSPGGISHNPAEDIRAEDVEAALGTLVNLLLHLHPHQ